VQSGALQRRYISAGSKRLVKVKSKVKLGYIIVRSKA